MIHAFIDCPTVSKSSEKKENWLKSIIDPNHPILKIGERDKIFGLGLAS